MKDIDNHSLYPRICVTCQIVTEDSVIINGTPIPISNYAKVPMDDKKKVRRKALIRLRNKYRMVIKPLPRLHGDFDGDVLNLTDIHLGDPNLIEITNPKFILRPISINKK